MPSSSNTPPTHTSLNKKYYQTPKFGWPNTSEPLKEKTMRMILQG